MTKKNESAQWVSMSDMMTGLMLIFLLLAIAFMYQVQLKQKEKDKILIEYNQSNIQLYKELKNNFSDKEKIWGMKITPDLEIKFNRKDINFETDKYSLPEKFKDILKDFIPKYLKIINNKKYSDKIKEIKILGHTGKCKDFEYEECLILSQMRANSVLMFLQQTKYFKSLNERDKSKLNFWFTSNGMGDGKLLDSKGKFVYNMNYTTDEQIEALKLREKNKDLANAKSRRVEFKIVTNSDNVIKNVINK